MDAQSQQRGRLMTLAARIRNADGVPELGAHAFGGTMTAFFLGFFGRPRTIVVLNTDLTANGFGVLTAAEEAELDTMQAQYDSLSQLNGLQYFTRIDGYSGLLQQGRISASEWEAQVGL